MTDEAKEDVLKTIESPATATTSTRQESQPGFRSPGEARQILSEHLKLMLEKPTVPWGDILAWSEGNVVYIPTYSGHIMRASDERGETMNAAVREFMRGRGFTGEPTQRSCSWAYSHNRMSSDMYFDESEGEKGAFKTVKPEDRQVISYTGEVSGDYEIYTSDAYPGVSLICAKFSPETISEGHKGPSYSAEKAKALGLKPPEPSKSRILWQIYRTRQKPEAKQPEPGYVANQRREGSLVKSDITEILPLPSPGPRWSMTTKVSPPGNFRG